jgi:hypothetical protein
MQDMNTLKIKFILLTLVSAFSLPPFARLHAATTIDPANRYAYGANLGWVDWRGDTANGAVIGEYVCSGYIYSANVGWINLGSGAPANGIQYQNNSGTDFGVNQDGHGNLRGYGYGANIGWVNFETNGAPKFSFISGKFSGSIYSANCGWISLSNASAFVQTDVIAPGADTDGDGIPDAWELQNFGNLTTANASSDADHDGATDLQEYLADTNPNDANDKLVITAESFGPGGTNAALTWKSTTTRLYYIQQNLNLNTSAWADNSLGLITPDGTNTTRAFGDTNAPSRFYRIRAVKPLSP